MVNFVPHPFETTLGDYRSIALASGQFDPLSGRFVEPSDDLERMLASAQAIGERALYTLQVPRL